MHKLLSPLAAAAFMLGGCSLIPDYQRPDAPIAGQYPQASAYAPALSGPIAAEQGWRDLFQDPALQQLIESALVNNRDLRVAALTVEAYPVSYTHLTLPTIYSV